MNTLNPILRGLKKLKFIVSKGMQRLTDET